MANLLAAATDELLTTVTGLTVVFTVLILLWVILEIMNYFFREPDTGTPRHGAPSRTEVKEKERIKPSPATPEPQRDPVPAQQRVVEHEPAPDPPFEIPSDVSPRTTAAIAAAVVNTVGYIPEHMSIRTAETHAPQKVAAVVAAVVESVGGMPQSLSIRTARDDRKRVAAITAAAAAYFDDESTSRAIRIDKVERR